MTIAYTPNGDTVNRSDGKTGYPVVYRDSDGRVAAKAFIPKGHKPEIPDHVDIERSEVVSLSELQELSIHERYRTDS